MESNRWKDVLKHEAFELPVINEEPNQADEELAESVLHFDLNRLKTLVNGIEPSKRGKILQNSLINGRPLLNYASVNGYSELVRCLLDFGVNPLESLTKNSGRTALHEAIRGGFIEIVEILVKNVGKDETDGLSNVRESGRRSSLALESLAALDQTGMLVNAKDQVGLTPILILAESSSLSAEQFTSMVYKKIIK